MRIQNHHPDLVEGGQRASVMAGLLIIAGLVTMGNKLLAGGNLLVNGNFNNPASISPWSTWTTGAAGVGYANHEVLTTNVLIDMAHGSVHPNNTGNYDGTYQMTLGATDDQGEGGGVYQIVQAVAGKTYTLSVDAGAQGWWLPTGQIRLFFLDGLGNQLALTETNTTDSLHNSSNGGQGDQYDIGVPYQHWSLSAVAPAGATQAKVEFAGYGGGSCWFDNAALTSSYDPPTISQAYPDGSTLLQATNVFSFTAASSTTGINPGGIQLVLNGSNVSSGLVITGGPLSYNVTYTGLYSNSLYTASIMVTDTNGIETTSSYNFDTFKPTMTWEGEDWDFGGGQFISNPILSSTAQAGSYFGQTGVQGIDENTLNDAGIPLTTPGAPYNYRASDSVATSPALDVPRQNVLNAQAGNPNIQDYMLCDFNPGMWVNYTRTFPAGTYNIYARAGYGGGGTSSLYLAMVVSGQGASVQGTTNIGTFFIPSSGWTTYTYVPCIDQFGNLARVTLSGTTNTFRLTAGMANVNFFMLVPARTDLPRIENVYPDGATLLQGTNVFSFSIMAATSPATPINTNGIILNLNGANVPLTFVASGNNWNVTAPWLVGNTNYTAIVSVTDTASNAVAATVYFDTFNGVNYTWEAEDYDYNGGSFIDNPVPTSAPATNSYFGLQGVQGTDYYLDPLSIVTGEVFLYRPNDYIATDVCLDTPLQKYVQAQVADPAINDYCVAWWATNSWINYTRTYPAGTYNIYARLSGDVGATYTVQLAKVTVGATNSLGSFSHVGRGYNAYDWVPLINGGSNAVVSLGGVATLQAETGGQANANRYMLVPASAVLPFHVSISLSAGNALLSFPTQLGHSYITQYKNHLTDPAWTLLSTYIGDGSTQTHAVGPAGAPARFYIVQIQ
jgi:hypothetical protein